MTVKDRIKAYCKAEKMTVSAFEESIGASNGYVNAISKSIGIDKLNTIVEKFSNLNIEWLLTGRGEMLKSNCAQLHTSLNKTATNPNEDTEKNSITQQANPPSGEIIDRLVAQITLQAQEIGRLQERIAQLEREQQKNASGAAGGNIANAG